GRRFAFLRRRGDRLFLLLLGIAVEIQPVDVDVEGVGRRRELREPELRLDGGLVELGGEIRGRGLLLEIGARAAVYRDLHALRRDIGSGERDIRIDLRNGERLGRAFDAGEL